MRIDESLSFLRENKKEKVLCKCRLLREQLETLCYIILFGSYARGEETAVSDIDILVLTEDEIEREKRGELCSEFDKADMDLVFYTLQQFQSSNCLLVKEIRKEGIVIWKRK